MIPGADGTVTWMGPNYMPDSGRYQLAVAGIGMYDGLAGIGLFLAALARVTGNDKWRALAIGAFKPVRDGLRKDLHPAILHAGIGGASGFGSIVYALSRSWFDMRDNLDGTPFEHAHPKFGGAGCHGAPGIGLARIGGLGELDNANVRSDIEAALQMTASTMTDLEIRPDHMCCGNVGRIELLQSAGARLEREDLTQAARRAGAQVIANAADGGGFIYSSFTQRGVFAPGLFIGGAGIGYQLLRLAAPEVVPNVLLWE